MSIIVPYMCHVDNSLEGIVNMRFRRNKIRMDETGAEKTYISMVVHLL